MKILGYLIIAMGLVDLVGSYADFDLWGGFFGVQLPDLLWQFSAYIEIAAGYLLTKIGSNAEESEPEPQSEEKSD